MPELIAIEYFRAWLRSRQTLLRQNEDGYSTETVLVSALLAALAIAVLAIISVKVIAKANSISTE